MKKLTFIFTFLIISLLSFAQSYKEITVATPGQLEETLDTDWDKIDSIIIRGAINKADFQTLYYCALRGKLSRINLREANVEGNKIPAFALYYPDIMYGSLNIQQIILPDNIVEIGEYAFSLLNLKSLILPSKLKVLARGAFQYCKSIEGDIIIPEGVTEIGGKCFYQCQGFKKLVLPQSLKKIGYSAFYDTRMEEMNLPEGLEIIENYAFFGSDRLRELIIPESITHLGEGCFQENFSLHTIQLPSGITEIPINFLSDNKSLNSLIVPDNVTTIHEGAFRGPIKEVQLSKKLKTIGANAFDNNCLTEILLPESIEYIGENAFGNSQFLERVYSMAKIPPMTAYYYINGKVLNEDFHIFQSLKECTLYVPKGSGDLYRDSPFWVDFKNIVETDNFPSSCGITFAPNCKATASEGTIIINNLTNKTLPVRIYGINGNLIHEEKVSGTHTIAVSPGIYLVKAGNKTEKVIVK